jgi:hypothetical protein
MPWMSEGYRREGVLLVGAVLVVLGCVSKIQ